MKFKAVFAVVAATNVKKSDTKKHGHIINCYYTNWSQYRDGVGKFFPEDIDTTLCTHLTFSFAKVVAVSESSDNNEWTLEPYEWNDLDSEWSDGLYTRLNNLKKSNPILKTLIAVGGWNHGSSPFSKMVSTDAGIESFVSNSMKYARENGFDGIDLDWEYPAKCSSDCSPESDAARFRTLCERFRSGIDAENVSSANRFLVTAAVGIGQDKIYPDPNNPGHTVASYDPKHMTDFLDFVNLMSYDMHGHWESETGHQALAHKISSDDRRGGTTNLEWILDNWIALGADPAKLNLGLAAYGRSFKLKDPNINGYRAACTVNWAGMSSGSAGRYTREAGYLAYYEICAKLRDNGWTEVWLDEGKVPYAYGDGDWVGYDNVESINYKVDMAKAYGLGGIMWWTTAIDDFNGTFCGQGKYPLMTAARNNWLEDYLDLLSEAPDELIAIVENSNPGFLENVPDLLDGVPDLMVDSDGGQFPLDTTLTPDVTYNTEDGYTKSSSKQLSAYVPFVFFILMKSTKNV